MAGSAWKEKKRKKRSATTRARLEGKERTNLVDEHVVETEMKLVILVSNSMCGSSRSHLVGRLEHGREIQELGLLRTETLVDFEHLGVSVKRKRELISNC